jgi:hypothetical protein
MLWGILASSCSPWDGIRFQMNLERLHLCEAVISQTDPPNVSVLLSQRAELGQLPLIQIHACSLKHSSDSLIKQGLIAVFLKAVVTTLKIWRL